MAKPLSFPSNSGNTLATARAAPVVVGMIESAAALARLKSLCMRSSVCWSFVYAWTVVMSPLIILKLSLSILATGARQFVVHDAFDTT